MNVILSLLTGLMAGIVFGFLKLPIPAPPSFGGLLGIVGLTIGYLITREYVK